ncbi:MAG: RHS repeat-associated core domain-containing protein, partial [Chthoniobacterales bacterium]
DDPTNPGADVNLFPPRGGYLTFSGYNTTNQTYAMDVVSNTTLVLTSATSYERFFPDGSAEIYAQPNGVNGPGRQVFLTELVDPQGNKLTFTYDSQYRLVGVKDAIGQVTKLHYALKTDPLKITSVTDPFGRTAYLTYTSVNGTLMLSSTKDVVGIQSKFEYDGGLVHQLTTPYGKTQFYFAENFGDIGTGRSVDIYDPAGGHSRVEYNQDVNYPFSDSLVPSGMDLFNEYLNYRDTFFWDQHAMAVAPYVYTEAMVYHFQHTPDGASTSRLLEATCKALESRVWRNYPGQGQSAFQNGVYIGKPSLVGRVLDASGTTQLAQYSYNSLANVTAVVDPAGRSTQYTYAPNGIDIIQTQQWDGATYQTTMSAVYNTQHRPTQITDAAGQITDFKYNSFGEVTKITDAKHEVTTYNYDTHGYLQNVVNALSGTQASFTYDTFGRVLTYTDADGFTKTYGYDNLNRITKISYPDGTSDSYQYQAMSLIQWTNRLNNVTHYKYNSLQQMIEVIDPLGRDTQFSYCGCGSLDAITDGDGNTTTFVRDVEERLIQKIYPDNSTVNCNYDLGGRLSSVVDAKNQTTTYTRGVDNLLSEVTYAAPTPGVAFTYDAFRRLASMTDGTGTTTYSYWNVGQLGALQLDAEVRPAGYGTIYHNYDQLGRVVEDLIYDTAGTLDKRSYTYDAIGRVTQQANGLGTSTYKYVGTTPMLQTLTEPNKQTFGFQYYGATGNFWLQGMQQVTGSNTLSHQYTYDAMGNMLSWQQTNPADGTGTWNLTYDADNELSTFSATATAGTGLALGQGNYTYDPGINLKQVISSSTLGAFQGAVYQVNGLNQVTSITPGSSGSTTIGYDANGNALNGIAAVSANPKTVTGALTYTWDGANRLIGIAYAGTGNSTAFTYDGVGRLVQLTETTNSKTSSNALYVWMGRNLAEQRTTKGTITKEYFPQGFKQGATDYFYGKDHLGSTRNLTDITGTIQTQIDYGLYGELTEFNGTIHPDIGYAGLFYHQRSGLHFALARAYDNGLKRWLNRDPIREVGGINLYAYVGGRPTFGIDRSGLDYNGTTSGAGGNWGTNTGSGGNWGTNTGSGGNWGTNTGSGGNWGTNTGSGGNWGTNTGSGGNWGTNTGSGGNWGTNTNGQGPWQSNTNGQGPWQSNIPSGNQQSGGQGDQGGGQGDQGGGQNGGQNGGGSCPNNDGDPNNNGGSGTGGSDNNNNNNNNTNNNPNNNNPTDGGPGSNGTPYWPGLVPNGSDPYSGWSPIYDSNGNLVGMNSWNI